MRSKQTGFRLACLGVFTVSLALRLVNIDARSIWFDEASSWLTANMPLADLTHSLTQSTHVPLYYPVLRIWMSVFGDSPTALRSLSVLLGMCTAIGSGWLGWLVLHSSVANRPRGERETSDVEGTTSQTKWFGLFCAAVCGLNAFQVHASVEARMYSLGTFLTILSTGLALHVRSNPDCLRHWMLLTIVTLASLYTHHLLALTALVQALWLAWHLCSVPVTDRSVNQPQRRWMYWKLSVGAVTLGWMPALLLWWKQFHRIQQGFWIPAMDAWTLPRTCLEFFASPPPGRWWEFREFGVPVLLSLVFVFCFVWTMGGPKIRLLVLQSLVPMVVVGLVSLKTPLWEARYFRFAHVSILLCVAFCVWNLSTRIHARRMLASITLLTMFCGSLLFWQWRDIPKRQANRGAAMLINSDAASARVPVVVTSPIDFIVMKYYGRQLQWPAERVKLWTGKNRDAAAAVHLISDADWWHPPASDSPANDKVWLVEPVQSESLIPEVLLNRSVGVFRSDLWLDAWTVRIWKTPINSLL
ncbi:MAG: hypothetical protein WAO83_06265 [Fuerstiella sp.]